MKKLITKNVFFLITIFLLCLNSSPGQTSNVGIGTTTPDNSAILELLTTSKGLLIPRLTTAERDAITNPATSLLIYNTSNSQYEYNVGTPASPSWIALASSAGLSNVFGSGSDGQIAYWNSSTTLTGSNDLFWDYTNTRLGIGNNTPRERLDLEDAGGYGALIIGNSSSSFTGTIRWNGSDFEGYDGSQWLSFTASSTINGAGTSGQVTYWSGAGLLSGNDDLFWDATNSILGIGTNTPSSTVTLDVNGNVLIQNNLEVSDEISGKALLLNPLSSAPTSAEGKIYYNDSDNNVKVYDGSIWKNIGGIWEESGADAYRLTGNVGIGRSSPRERLDLQDLSGDGALIVGNTSSSYTGAIKWDGFDFYGYTGSDWVSLTTGGGGGGGSSTITGSGTAGQVTVWSSTSTLMGSNDFFWNNVAGRLGIGDNTPDHTVDIAGNLGLDANSYINFTDVDGTTGYGFRDNSGVIEFKNSGGSWSNFNALSGGDVFGAGNGTVGHVAWWTSSSTITGVANLFWDNNNIRLGVGDNTPDHMLDVGGNIGLNTSAYINFGDVDGTTGYGFRDNAGVIEFKNSGGSWQNFSALSGGDVYGGGTGSAGEVAFWTTSSTITGSSNLFWDDNNSMLSIGSNGADGFFRLFSEQGVTDYDIVFTPNSLMTESTTYTLPPDYGSSGQVLTTDGNGLLNWTTVSGGGGGGNVYGNGSNGQIAFWNSSSTITGVNNLFWNDTQNRLDVVGTIQAGKDGTDGAFSLFSEQGATDYEVMFIPNPAMTESTTYTLPEDNGTNGQVLSTDGSGDLSWITISSGGNVVGSGVAGQVAYWSTSGTITGNNGLFFDEGYIRLGIGDNTPDHTVDVAGNIGLDAGGYINFGDVDGAGGYGIWDDAGILKYRNDGGSWTTFPTGNTLDQAYDQGGAGAGKFIIVDAGTVGLYGSNSGTFTMELSNSANGGVLRLDNNGTGNSLRVNESSGNYPFVITNNGRVGLGTSAPSAMLDIIPQTTDAIIINPNLTAVPTNLKFVDAVGGEYIGFVAPATVSTSTIWTLPASDGTSGQVLTTDGSGVLNWTTSGGVTLDGAYDFGGAGAGRIITVDNGSVDLQGSNVANYTLSVSNSANGGTLYLDNNGTGNGLYLESGATSYPFIINSSGNVGIGTTNPNAQLEIEPSGADAIIINPNASSTPTTLKFVDAAGGDYVGFQAPSAITTSIVWTLPTSDGTNGQSLVTDGAGNLSWANGASGSPADDDGAIQYNNSGAFGGDDTQLFWDDTNGRLGVGTNTPSDKVHVQGAVLRDGWLMVYKTSAQAVTNSLVNDVTWNGQIRVDSPAFFTHTSGSANITVVKSGWYRISFNLNYQNNGGNWTVIQAWVVDDGTEILGSRSMVLLRDNNNHDYGHTANSFITQIGAGSVLRVQVQRTTAEDFDILTNSQVNIERIDE